MKSFIGKLRVRGARKVLLVTDFIVSRTATGIGVMTALLASLAAVVIVLAPSPTAAAVVAHLVGFAAALVSSILLSSLAGEYSSGGALFYYMLPVSREKLAASIILSYAVLPLFSLIVSIVAPVLVLVPSAFNDAVVVSLGFTVLWTAMTIWIALASLSMRAGSGVVVALALIYVFAAPMVAMPFLAFTITGQGLSLSYPEKLGLYTLIGLLAPGVINVASNPFSQPGYDEVAVHALILDWVILVLLYAYVYRRLSSLEA